jgi:hypothetical protein
VNKNVDEVCSSNGNVPFGAVDVVDDGGGVLDVDGGYGSLFLDDVAADSVRRRWVPFRIPILFIILLGYIY